jgi:hypothetical protein
MISYVFNAKVLWLKIGPWHYSVKHLNFQSHKCGQGMSFLEAREEGTPM